MPVTYRGPFNPPPAMAVEGALGWTFETETDPENPGKWRPTAWKIILPDSILTVNYETEIAMSERSLFTVEETTKMPSYLHAEDTSL